MGADNLFYVKFIATYAPTFFGYIISVLAIVSIPAQKSHELESNVKFGFFEKGTKFEKIFLVFLKNQLIYLVNVKTMRKIFSKLWTK